MKKIMTALLGALCLVCLAAGVLLADSGAVQTEEPSVPLVPLEIHTEQMADGCLLEKVYRLSGSESPQDISTADCEYEGRRYTFRELRQEELKTDSKPYSETVESESTTDRLEEILKTLAPELLAETEDGYSGVLQLAPAEITITPKGYQSYSRTVTATRTYPNLSDADTSLLPKTVQENGRTLTLAGVDWQSAATDYVDGYDMAIRYTAVARYSTTVTGRNTTGYLVRAVYRGEVSRPQEEAEYTAVFVSRDHASLAPIKGPSVPFFLLALLSGAALLYLAVQYGREQYRHYRNRKKGYEL